MPQEDRVIANFGIFKVPQDSRKAREFKLYGRVERKDRNASFNYKSQFESSFYGYIQKIYRGCVVWTKPISFEDELLDSYNFEQKQSEIYDFCRWKYLAVEVFAIGQLQGTNPRNPDDFEPSALTLLDVDYYAVKLFGKTTLILDLYWDEFDRDCIPELVFEEPLGPLRDATGLFPVQPENVPLNEEDPLGYDLPDPSYDGEGDEGLSYDPARPPEVKYYKWSGTTDPFPPTGSGGTFFEYIFGTTKSPSLGAVPPGCPTSPGTSSLYLDGQFVAVFTNCDRLIGSQLVEVFPSDTSGIPEL